MKSTVRKDPRFALCGLNCCLCPRYNSGGASRCPGCGGPGFSEAHPTCAVVTCNAKRDCVEFCFQCGEYPCRKYEEQGAYDSFISYRRVRRNLDEAAVDLAAYEAELARREEALRELLRDHNDGRSKSLYCIVANDAPLDDLVALIGVARGLPGGLDPKERARRVRSLISDLELRLGFEFRLRRP